MAKNQTTVVGNLTRDPETRHFADGSSLAEITVAENSRRRDQDNEWRDVRTSYWTVTCWRLLGVHVAASLKKGDRVVVTGESYLDEWTGADGQTRSKLKIDPSSVALDLSRAPARVVRFDGGVPPARGADGVADGPGWAEEPPARDDEDATDPYDGAPEGERDVRGGDEEGAAVVPVPASGC